MKNCKDIVMIVEKRELEGLGLLDRLRLRFHFLLCKGCEKYGKDSALLHKLLCQQKQRLEEKIRLSTEEKSLLKSRISNQ